MKVALCGVWHVHAFDYTKAAMKHGEVIGFYEKNDALAHEYQQKFDIPRFPTMKDLLESEAEGVIVCSATAAHTEDMIRIANAKKHIFTEKVLALTDEDCLRVEEAIKANGVHFVISLVQKYHAHTKTIKAIVDSGELGKINYVRFRNCHGGSVAGWLPKHFYNETECGGGAMIDLGAHGMYLIHWLLGIPQSMKSTFTLAHPTENNTDGVEDNAVTVMQYANGAIAVNETSFVNTCFPIMLEVHGENGSVYLENNGETFIKRTISTNYETVPVEPQEASPLPIEQFMTDKILEGCGIEDAKALTHMMVMAYH